MATIDRRSEHRLTLADCMVFAPSGGTGRVIDVSSAGVGVELDTRCLFARGETHRLTLSDVAAQSVEVEGTVRWTQSAWKSPEGSPDNAYVQAAGLSLSSVLTPRPAELWSTLLEDLPVAAEAVEPVSDTVATTPPPDVAPTPLPAVEMIEPTTGSSIRAESVTVICVLREPELITTVRINRMQAIVLKDMATTTVRLQRGTNRIMAMVSRRDGSYSTYLLGKLERPVDD